MLAIPKLAHGDLGSIVVVDFGQLRSVAMLASTLRDNPGGYSVFHLDPTDGAAQMPGATMSELALSYDVSLEEQSVVPTAVVGYCGGSVLSDLLVRLQLGRGRAPLNVLIDPARPSPESLYSNFRVFREDIGLHSDPVADGGAAPGASEMIATLEGDLDRYTTSRGMDPLEKKIFVDMMMPRYKSWFAYAAMCFDRGAGPAGADLCVMSSDYHGEGEYRAQVRVPASAYEMFQGPEVVAALHDALKDCEPASSTVAADDRA